LAGAGNVAPSAVVISNYSGQILLVAARATELDVERELQQAVPARDTLKVVPYE
jgi:hypothetical protein